MARFRKWPQLKTADARAIDVAAQSLKQRLKAVAHYLSRADGSSGDQVETIHQLRIWTRRAGAVLEFFDGEYPAERAAKLDKYLQKVRKAANAARDDDVLIERLESDLSHPGASRLLKRIRKHREKAQRPVDRAMRKYGGELQQRGKKLRRNALRQADQCGCTQQFSTTAAARLKTLVGEFVAAGSGDLSDVDRLHQFRIQAKRLRYAVELASPIFADAVRDELAERVTLLQEKLGEVNDHAVAKERFKQLLEKAGDNERDYLTELLQYEGASLEQAHSEFLTWWLAHQDSFRAAFERALAPQPNTPMNDPPQLGIAQIG